MPPFLPEEEEEEEEDWYCEPFQERANVLAASLLFT